MREILFKAKRIDNGQWVEGSLIDSGNHGQVFIFPPLKGASIMPCRKHVYYEMVGVDSDTICQYTGLTDKNGRKIFEGDIVTSGSDSTGRKYYSEVCYDEFNCSCCNGVYGWTFVGGCGDIREYKQYEVVGNVFDNYELLEQPEGN